jgi:hypothetical protein
MSLICETVKKDKEVNASFIVILHTKKVMVTVSDKHLIKR